MEVTTLVGRSTQFQRAMIGTWVDMANEIRLAVIEDIERLLLAGMEVSVELIDGLLKEVTASTHYEMTDSFETRATRTENIEGAVEFELKAFNLSVGYANMKTDEMAGITVIKLSGNLSYNISVADIIALRKAYSDDDAKFLEVLGLLRDRRLLSDLE